MKRILTVLVLLVTVSLVSASASIPSAYADEPGSIAVPLLDVRSGDLDGDYSGPSGDPDGMGTGDGVDEAEDSVLNRSGGLSGSGTDSELGMDDYLFYLLSLMQLLAL